MIDTSNCTIGQRIQFARIIRGMTQGKLAEMLNVSLSMISRVEKNERSIRVERLVEIATALNVTVDYLLGITPKGISDIEKMQIACEYLGVNETDPDYWKATEGNAKRALIQLLAMAKMRPDGIFDFG